MFFTGHDHYDALIVRIIFNKAHADKLFCVADYCK